MGSRRAMALWSWRLVRREWRQQILVLALVAISIALASFFAVIFANSNGGGSGAFRGTATHEFQVFAGQAPLAEQQREVVARFDPIAVTAQRAGMRQKGSPYDFDVSDSVIETVFGRGPFAVTEGTLPTAAGEIAVSDSLMRRLGTSIGETIELTDRSYRVVGRFEDRTDLRSLHAIVAPGMVLEPTALHILVRSDDATVRAFEESAGRDRFITSVDLSAKANSRFVNTMLAYLMTSVGMVEIGLLCAAGFAVMARRRIREFGMLGAIGAKERELRQAMAINGLLIGVIGGSIGVAAGFGSSLLFQPSVERFIGARIGFWGIPWSGILPFVALAAMTATLAAWWPARAISRASIVESVAARRPVARPVRRTALVALVAVVAGSIVHSWSIGTIGAQARPAR